jgi:ligand-binding sensor protein
MNPTVRGKTMKRIDCHMPAGDFNHELEFGPRIFSQPRTESRCAGCTLRRGQRASRNETPLDRPCVMTMMAIIAGEPLL